MKLNNKGIAITSTMYIILILAIILIASTLGILSSRKIILDKLNSTTKEDIDTTSTSYKELLEKIKAATISYASTNIIDVDYVDSVSVSKLVDGNYFSIDTEEEKNKLISDLKVLNLYNKYIG